MREQEICLLTVDWNKGGDLTVTCRSEIEYHMVYAQSSSFSSNTAPVLLLPFDGDKNILLVLGRDELDFHRQIDRMRRYQPSCTCFFSARWIHFVK